MVSPQGRGSLGGGGNRVLIIHRPMASALSRGARPSADKDSRSWLTPSATTHCQPVFRGRAASAISFYADVGPTPEETLPGYPLAPPLREGTICSHGTLPLLAAEIHQLTDYHNMAISYDSLSIPSKGSIKYWRDWSNGGTRGFRRGMRIAHGVRLPRDPRAGNTREFNRLGRGSAEN